MHMNIYLCIHIHAYMYRYIYMYRERGMCGVCVRLVHWESKSVSPLRPDGQSSSVLTPRKKASCHSLDRGPLFSIVYDSAA